jgi:metallophosphoesterase (TIGR00282 family)
VRILFIGDVIGGPGRRILRDYLDMVKQQYAPDLTIANGENLAGGLGATPQLIREISTYGVQVVTMGNHTWRRADMLKGIEMLDNVVRPANYPPSSPGEGSIVYELDGDRRVAIFNLVGRVYMDPNDCPFRRGLEIARTLREETPIVILDMHAEATSEKAAIAWYLDGKVSAVLGTHTHVQTADERILPQGTAYITDVGMTGPHDSIIGMKQEQVLTRFVTGIHSRYEVADQNLQLDGVVVDVDDLTGQALHIERVSQQFNH